MKSTDVVEIKAISMRTTENIMSLTEEELKAREFLSSFAYRHKVPIKENTGLYALKSVIKKRPSYMKNYIHRPPFKEDDWLAIIELEIAYRSKKPNKEFRTIYRPKIAELIKRVESSKTAQGLRNNKNIEGPKQLTTQQETCMESSGYYVYKIEPSEGNNVAYIYGSVDSRGIVFCKDNKSSFESESEVEALARMLNKYNTEYGVKYGYGSRGYVVKVKDTFLVYKSEKDKALYFTDLLEEATLFTNQRDAAEAREKVLLVFDIDDKDVVEDSIIKFPNLVESSHPLSGLQQGGKVK